MVHVFDTRMCKNHLIWVPSVYWFCNTFEICIYNKRNWEFLVMISEKSDELFGGILTDTVSLSQQYVICFSNNSFLTNCIKHFLHTYFYLVVSLLS